MGVRKRAQIGHIGTIGHEIENDALGRLRALGYVAPVVAVGVTRATGVRHIYLIV